MIREMKAKPISNFKILLYAMLIAMGLFILVNACINVHAVTSKESIKENYDVFFAGFKETTFEHMKKSYDSFKELFQPGAFSTKSSTNVNNALKGFADMIMGVGQTLVIMHMLINIIQLAARNELIEQYWTKLMVTTVIAVIAIIALPHILKSIYNLGNYLIDSAIKLNMSGKTPSDKKAIIKQLSTLPGMEHLKDILGDSKENIKYSVQEQTNDMLNVLKYIAWLPLIASMFLTFSSVFEIKVREVFAPIAIASIASGGARSGGVRYLLKYLACFLKMAIYFVIAFIGSVLMIGFYNQALKYTGSGVNMPLVLMILSPIVTAMAMMQTGGLGDEILGV